MPTCAQGHEWVMGALADLVDNAYRSARHSVHLDVWFADSEDSEEEPYLSLRDDGPGLDYDAVRTIFAAGTASKAPVPPPSATSPLAGTSWLAAACRVGCDICVLSKTVANKRYIGLLSRTAIADGALKQVLVADWDDEESKLHNPDWLNFIHYTPWKSFAAVDSIFDSIGSSGVLVAIFSLRRDMEEGRLELDIESDDKDIVLAFNLHTEDEPRLRTSLRAYLQVFYLDPGPCIRPPRIYLRGAIVRETRIRNSLVCPRDFEYRPRSKSGCCYYRLGLHPACFYQGKNGEAKTETVPNSSGGYAQQILGNGNQVSREQNGSSHSTNEGMTNKNHSSGTFSQNAVPSATPGLENIVNTSCQMGRAGNSHFLRECGLLVYYHGRLIWPYVRLGALKAKHPCGVPATRLPSGTTYSELPPVVGVVQADLWLPTPNYQDFVLNDDYKRTKTSLERTLQNYVQHFWTNPNEAVLEELSRPVDTWLQCDKCSAWRIVADPIHVDMSNVHAMPSWDCSKNTGGTSVCGASDDPVRVVPRNLVRNYSSARVHRPVTSNDGVDQSFILNFGVRLLSVNETNTTETTSKIQQSTELTDNCMTQSDLKDVVMYATSSAPDQARAVYDYAIMQKRRDNQYASSFYESQNGGTAPSEDDSTPFLPELDLNARTPEPHELPITEDIGERGDFALLPSLSNHEDGIYDSTVAPMEVDNANREISSSHPYVHVPEEIDDDSRSRNAEVRSHEDGGVPSLFSPSSNAQKEGEGHQMRANSSHPNLPVSQERADATGAHGASGVAAMVHTQGSSLGENDEVPSRDVNRGNVMHASSLSNCLYPHSSLQRIMSEPAHQAVEQVHGSAHRVPEGPSAQKEAAVALVAMNRWSDTSSAEPTKQQSRSDASGCRENNVSCSAEHHEDLGGVHNDGTTQVAKASVPVVHSETQHPHHALHLTENEAGAISVEKAMTYVDPGTEHAIRFPLERTDDCSSPNRTVPTENGTLLDNTAEHAFKASHAKAGQELLVENRETTTAFVRDTSSIGLREPNGTLRTDINVKSNHLTAENQSEGSNGPSHDVTMVDDRTKDQEDLNSETYAREIVTPVQDVTNAQETPHERSSEIEPPRNALEHDICLTQNLNEQANDNEDWKVKYIALVNSIAPEALSQRCLSVKNVSLNDADDINNDVLRAVEDAQEDNRRELRTANASLRIACAALDHIRRLVRLFMERAVGIIRPDDDDDEPIESHFHGYLRMIDVIESADGA